MLPATHNARARRRAPAPDPARSGGGRFRTARRLAAGERAAPRSGKQHRRDGCWRRAARWAKRQRGQAQRGFSPLAAAGEARHRRRADASRRRALHARDIEPGRRCTLGRAPRASCPTAWTSRPKAASASSSTTSPASRHAGRVDRHLRQRHGAAERLRRPPRWSSTSAGIIPPSRPKSISTKGGGGTRE